MRKATETLPNIKQNAGVLTAGTTVSMCLLPKMFCQLWLKLLQLCLMQQPSLTTIPFAPETIACFHKQLAAVTWSVLPQGV